MVYSKVVGFPSVLIGDTTLQQVTVQKYLSVLIDENLTWTAHVSKNHVLLFILDLILYLGYQ